MCYSFKQMSIDQHIHTRVFIIIQSPYTASCHCLTDPFMCRYAFCAQHGLYSTQMSCSCVSNSEQAFCLSFPRGRPTWSHPLAVFDRMFPFPGLSCPICQFCQTRRETPLLPTFYCFLRLLRQFVVPARSLIFELFLAWICICSQISLPVGFFLWLYFHKSKKKKNNDWEHICGGS